MFNESNKIDHANWLQLDRKFNEQKGRLGEYCVNRSIYLSSQFKGDYLSFFCLFEPE
jgi:hypothetical protein